MEDTPTLGVEGNSENKIVENADSDSAKTSEKVTVNDKKKLGVNNNGKSSDKFLLKITSDTIETPSKQSSEDEDDDDVPGDFFDDFLKEDFMAGLDIVDEDEGEEKPSQGADDSSKTVVKKKKKATPQKKKKRSEEKKINEDEFNFDLRNILKEKGKKDEEPDLRKVLKEKEEHRKSKKPKPINADEFDIRRDPKKTKRDIERDKARCEKDKEKKIISEKLKLVETGLVPPGMEMETDLDEMKKQKEKSDTAEQKEIKTSESTSSKTKRTSNSKKSVSPRNKRSFSPRLRRSPRRKLSPKRSPIGLSRAIRSRSPRRRSLPRRSPIRRSPLRKRSRERSPRRSIDRSFWRSREKSPRRSRERSPRRSRERVRDRSLRRSIDRDRRKSRSRDKYKYSPRHKRSHSRSLSPKRRREVDKKKSFLQEIADKLNDTRHVNIPYQSIMQQIPNEMYHIATHSHNLNPIPGPVSAPAPVPPPPMSNQFQSQQQYDKSFFIGTPLPQQNSPNLPSNVNVNLPSRQLLPGAPLPPMNSLPSFNQQPQNMLQEKIETKDGLSRLFQDKKITLTEFLAITAKPEVYSASPDHMKEKIKVISRCQDAIKYLGNSEKKLTGPLIIQKSQKPKAVNDKFKSPLVKSLQVKLPFTELPKNEKNRSDFTTYVNGLLQNLGLAKDDVIVIDDVEPTPQKAPTTKIAAPPPAPNISFNIQQRQTETKPGLKTLSKLCQTDEPRCIDCEKRKKILYKNFGTQCGNDGMAFSVGTQVSDDDFFAKLPKNQSFASLTPAQLLARSGASKPNRNIDEDDFDLLFPVKKPLRPQGYAYGAEAFGSSRFSPPKFNPPPPAPRPFDLPGAGGPRDRDMRNEGNRFNNYY